MISLNDYLYSGSTVLRILRNYERDLRRSAAGSHSHVDEAHCNFLLQIYGILEHNEFLTSQSMRIREFYQYMARNYPQLAFTLTGRIKSLIRSEAKFNGYVMECIYNYYVKNGTYPDFAVLQKRLSTFRDLIAYRIVISLPKCHLKPGLDLETEEIRILYELANVLPDFLEARGFSLVLSGVPDNAIPSQLESRLRPYYRDYVAAPKPFGYRSLHITLYDNVARCFTEFQLRTKTMDDNAKIGSANHLGYEDRQRDARSSRNAIPEGECVAFDEAWQRGMLLQNLDFSKLDVNMFKAYSNTLINDSCGLYQGRLITPYEHLSIFQNDTMG